MGSHLGRYQSGDPLFLAGAPGVSHLVPAALWWLARGKRRSLAEDAALAACLLDPQPRIEGSEHIPASEPFILVGNHYQPPGVWIGWVAAAITAAVARVEQRYPELMGGLGTYAAMGPRGPFVHIDVRGTSARWENDWWVRRGP